MLQLKVECDGFVCLFVCFVCLRKSFIPVQSQSLPVSVILLIEYVFFRTIHILKRPTYKKVILSRYIKL